MNSLFSVVALLALSAPPAVEITAKGTKITQGQTTISILPDGSIRIQSPTANLSLPGSDVVPLPPDNPPEPPKVDPLHEAIGTLYGSLQEEGKAEKAKALSNVWLKAISMVDKSETLGDLTANLKAVQTLKDDDLTPIRERIRDEIGAVLGRDPKGVLDKAKARALFSRIASGLEKAVS